MKKSAFTLIELLVVVAIIGILAAVGVVAYNGYTASAKIAATKANHKNIVNYIYAELIKCDLGGDNNTGKTMNGFLECVSKNYNNVISTAAVRGIQGFGATATYPIQNPYFSGVNGLSGGNIGSCSDLIKGSTRIDGGSTLSTGKVTVYSCITSSEKLTTTIQVD